MTTLVALDYRYENRVDVPLDSTPAEDEAKLFTAVGPLRDEWDLTHWVRWTFVVPFVDVDTEPVREHLRQAMEAARAASTTLDVGPAPPAGAGDTAVTIEGRPVPDLDALRGTADFPISSQVALDQTTLTFQSRVDRAELSVVATFTPEPGGPGEALRRAELGSSPERSSAVGPVNAVGNVATIDGRQALVTLTLADPQGPETDAVSSRLDHVIARLGPLA